MKKIIAILTAALSLTAAAFAENEYTETKLNVNGVILKESTVLWSKDANDGAIKWINGSSSNLAGGSEVKVTGDVRATLITSTGTTKGAKFYKIESNKKEYYVLQSQMAASSKEEQAVILKDTACYKRPLISSYAQGVLLAPSTKVSVTGKKYSNNGIEFAEIAYYSEKAYTKFTYYVPADLVSTKKDDIKAFDLIKQALSTKEEDLAEELFKDVLKLKTSEGVIDYYNTVR